MSYNKGDLVLVSNGEKTSTCILLTERFAVSSEDNYNFYYSYCIETGLYGIVYENEITTLVSEGFAPDFEFHSEIFETDYELYSELYDHFAYYPTFVGITPYGIDLEQDELEKNSDDDSIDD